MTFKLPRIRVKDVNGQYDETLTCIQNDSVSFNQEMNQTNQIDFTAANDGSIGYQLLQNENYLIFDGQTYRIKQADRDDSAFDIKRDVSATHIYFDCQYVMQYETIKGEKTVSAADLMSFVFDQNEIGNNGFTWQVFGELPKVQVTDYGNKSGLDCVNDCIEKFNVVIQMDNKNIKLIAMDSWQHKTNKSFRYIHDTPEFKMSIDTTSLQNITKVFGKTKDADADGKTDNPDVTDSETGSAIGTVNTLDPEGIPVYGTPGDDSTIVQHVTDGSHWIVDSKRTIDSVNWYRVSTNGWIEEKYITFEKPGDVKPENHIISDVLGRGTIKAADNQTDEADASTTDTTEHKEPTSANVYDSAWSPQKIVRTLDNGTQWRIDGEVSDGAQAKSWYRVSTNGWVAEEDFTFDGDTDIKPVEQDKPSTDTDTDDSDAEPEYYFEPFIVRDEESIKRWGERPGEAISDERFTDQKAMKEYALSTMQSQPTVDISLSYNGDDDLNLGDMVFADIQPESFKTWVTVTSIKTNPFIYNNAPEVSLNSTPQTLIDYELSIQNSIKNVGYRPGVMNAVDTLAGNSWGMGTITRKVGEVDD